MAPDAVRFKRSADGVQGEGIFTVTVSSAQKYGQTYGCG